MTAAPARRKPAALSVRGARVLHPEHGLRPATIHVADGVIVRIGEHDDCPAGVPLMDAGELVVLPGLVDTHVHVNEPGRADWEGFETATRAAAAGGITTIVDMPLNCIPATTTVAALEAKRRAAEGKCCVDTGFWGGVVPGNAGEIEPLAWAGVLGYKCFLSPSGVDEFQHVTEADLRAALPALARAGLPLLVHAELPGFLRPIDPHSDPRVYGTWLESRPIAAERAAIEMLLRLAAQAAVHIHIVHVAAAESLPAALSNRGSPGLVTTETCPHYLTFAAGQIADGATALKCAPPIREHAHREGLWEALGSGRIDLVASDHSPAPASLKRLADGDFVQAWGGIASLQVALSAVWTGAHARGYHIEDVVRWMSGAPARLAGLRRRKGAIAPGCDADLVFWDPDADITVDPSALEHRHPITPYAGVRLKGQVRRTLLRGEVIYEDGRFTAPPRGQAVTNRRGGRRG